MSSYSGISHTGNESRSLSAYLLLLLFSFLLPSLSLADNPVEKFVGSGAVVPESCSVVVIEIDGKKKLYSHNSEAPLIPASINKVVTIASLLEKTGIDYRYATEIYAGGKIKNGVLEGNLVVVGGGDPSLGATVEPVGEDIIAECVAALKDKGVTAIEGDIVVDESVFPGPATPPSWHPSDLSQSYGTGVHGLNYQRNASGKASVANPASVFVNTLRNALRREGIAVQQMADRPSNRKELLLKHLSPPIDEIMRSCMMRSDNLYAEAFLRTLALLKGKEATTENGADAEMDYWKKKRLPLDSVTIVDGSGLSRSNRMTADMMAEVLMYMADNVDFVSFFPLAGQEGTMRNFLKGTPLDGYIAFKTGSMNGIQCYAGYLLDEEYAPTHVVVVMINGFPKSRDAARKELASMLLEIFASHE